MANGEDITFHGGPDPYQPRLDIGSMATRSPYISGVSGGNDLDALLKSLLQPEPKVTPTKPSAAIIGGLGDALLAMAAVKSQGRFNPPPTFAETETARLEKEKAQQLAVQSRNTGIKAEIAVGEYKDKQAQDRAIENDRLLRAREAENDARDAAQKDREAALADLSDMAKDPNFAKWSETHMMGFDPAKATHAQVIDAKARFYGDMTGDQDIGNAIAALDTLRKTRPDLTKGMRLHVGISEKGKLSAALQEPGPQEAKQPPTKSGLSPAMLAAKSQYLGDDVTDLTLKEINQKIAAFAKQRQRWYKLSSEERDKYSTVFSIVKDAHTLADMIQSSKVGGAETFGFATSEEAAMFRAKASRMKDDILRWRSGAATTPADDAKIDYFTATLGNLTRNNLAALKEAEDFYRNKMKGLELDMPEDQIRYYHQRMNAGQSLNDAENEMKQNEQEATMPEVPPSWISN